MDRRRTAFTVLAVLCALPGLVYSDGALIPRDSDVGPFDVVYHRVKVTVDRQVATTEIDQAFRSSANRPVEATYVFPVADGLSLSKFAIDVDSEEITHSILEKDEARKLYATLVAERKSPALLEWLDTRVVQARVRAVKPGEDKRIKVAYEEVLKADTGAVKYVYPLAIEKLSAKPLQECSVEVTIRSAQPIRSVYSPSHKVTVQRDGERTARVTYQANNIVPDQDLVLYYTVSEEDLGADLLTYRDPQEGDGYFLLLAAPKADLSQDEVLPKDVAFVLDTSGSMKSHNKIRQAKAALEFCVNSLDPRDRFTVISFSNQVRPWGKGMQPATAENMRAAEEFVGKLEATGGTNINEALGTALEMLATAGDASRPPIVGFLTDGKPTVGVRDVKEILANVKATNKRNARVYDFGVGHDYNAPFLDKLAEDTNGYAVNVLPDEDIEVKVSDFYGKISAPILVNLAVDWGGVDAYDVYPQKLPDLFRGSQLAVVGRCEPEEQAKRTTLTLSGDIADESRTYGYDVTFASTALADGFIPRLWATRKIGYLEDEIRQNGATPELLEEVVRLSKEHGILSEYTAFLVDVDDAAPGGPRTNVVGKGDASLARDGLGRVAALRQQQTGAGAVAQSVTKKGMKFAHQAASTTGNVIMTADGRRVRMSHMYNIGRRTFVRSGTQWIDLNFKDEQDILKVKAYSPAYFQLLDQHPRMAEYLSVGGEVTIALEDTALQIGPEGKEELTSEELQELKTKMSREFGTTT